MLPEALTLTSNSLDSPERLAALEATGLLDTPPEEAFDRFTRLASRLLKCPVAIISLVEEERQFFKSALGLSEPWASLRESSLDYSFCQHVVSGAMPFVVPDARRHPLVHANPAIRDMGVVAYLGVPLTDAEGRTLGSLCAIDSKPHLWTSEAVETLQELALLVMNEVKLRRIGRELRQANADLAAAQEERDDLMHMLVHDLRNPLTSITAGLELMARRAEPEQADRLGLARHSAEHLLRMVGDILDVGKAEAGRLRLHYEEVPVPELVTEACAEVHYLAELSEVKLRVETGRALLPTTLDRDKMRRVLINCLANAIQHSPRGRAVTLTAETEESGPSLLFTIADEGEGIPAAVWPQLFEKYQVSHTRERGFASTGLGLPFCKKVIVAHGGEISLRSQPGHGACVCLRLPLRPAEEATRTEESPTASQTFEEPATTRPLESSATA